MPMADFDVGVEKKEGGFGFVILGFIVYSGIFQSITRT